jgi:hypothetical protein
MTMSDKPEKNILLVSDVRHVRALEAFLAENPQMREEGYVVIPLDLEIEYILAEKKIPFRSGREYRAHDTVPMTLGQEWAAAIVRDSRWSFFAYRDVSLIDVYSHSLQAYTTPLLYYADIVSAIFSTHQGIQRLVVFPPQEEPPAHGRLLVKHEMNIVVDVAVCMAQQRGIAVEVPKAVLQMSATTHEVAYVLKSLLFGIASTALNSFVCVIRRRRRIRILASDYWRNLAPFLQNLDSVEVLLLDKKEALNAGIANILKFRMRFLHLDSFANTNVSKRTEIKAVFKREWEKIRAQKDSHPFVFAGLSLQPLLLRVLDTFVDRAIDHDLASIDASYAMLARYKPDVVMLRATISGQTHFAILAHVARALNIPSLEMQHGLEYVGPGSFSTRHSAEFTGVYGPVVQKEMEACGDTGTTPVVIGSPRFDIYASRDSASATPVHNVSGITFVVIAPAIDTGLTFDTYAIEQYYTAIAFAARQIPNATVIIKLRPGQPRAPFLETMISRAFAGVSWQLAQFEPLSVLFKRADVVVSCYSTALLEAMQCAKPVVYVGIFPFEKLMGEHQLGAYVEQRGLAMATTQEELRNTLEILARDAGARESMVTNAGALLAREYAFDGHAGERAAHLIRSFAGKKQHSMLVSPHETRGV